MVALLVCGGTAAAQERRDSHAGYYYPRPATVEIYVARAKAMKSTTRARRIGFIINLIASSNKRPYPPTFDIFPKGKEAEKLIIVSNQAGRLDTIYRARALLATMTSFARTTPFFQKYRVETILTFLDLLKMLGFTQITVSDGDKFAHQIKLR